MKKNLIRIGVLAVLALLTLLIVVPKSVANGATTHVEALQGMKKEQTVQSTPEAPKTPTEPSTQATEPTIDIVATNPQHCDQNTQWIWSDGSCHNKEVQTQTVTASYPVPEDEAKAFIYMHESGNNPNAVNSIGCRGLGQACPGSKLPCGADYACQDAWFTNYMLARYGSWNNARAFWLNNHWW